MMRRGRGVIMWCGRGVMTATVRIEEPPPRSVTLGLVPGVHEAAVRAGCQTCESPA